MAWCATARVVIDETSYRVTCTIASHVEVATHFRYWFAFNWQACAACAELRGFTFCEPINCDTTIRFDPLCIFFLIADDLGSIQKNFLVFELKRIAILTVSSHKLRVWTVTDGTVNGRGITATRRNCIASKFEDCLSMRVVCTTHLPLLPLDIQLH